MINLLCAQACGARLFINSCPAGDLHGTHRSLVSLLHGVSYSTSRDTLLHTGDIVTKSTFDDSLRTLALLRQYGAKGVRGNNDQKVLEWRKWMEAYGPMPVPVVISKKKPVKAAAAVSGARQVPPSRNTEVATLRRRGWSKPSAAG